MFTSRPGRITLCAALLLCGKVQGWGPAGHAYLMIKAFHWTDADAARYLDLALKRCGGALAELDIIAGVLQERMQAHGAR